VRSRLSTDGLSLAYDGREVVHDLSVTIPDGAFTAIIGPNACGKSTLLRALVRLLKPAAGAALWDGRPVHTLPSKEVARQLGFLPQGLDAPPNITVAQLVARGRFPHQSVLRTWSAADEAAVTDALAACRVADIADRPMGELSGGQRQRAWIAMTLAQSTPYLLLDEPTTFLDLKHQFELLDLCARLRAEGRTIVAVLHDVNQACRYADHIIAMRGGRLAAAGPPAQTVDAALVQRVFELDVEVMPDPVTATPMIVAKNPGGATASRDQYRSR
jgi:iron complex transport system ATP-binding protein